MTLACLRKLQHHPSLPLFYIGLYTFCAPGHQSHQKHLFSRFSKGHISTAGCTGTSSKSQYSVCYPGDNTGRKMHCESLPPPMAPVTIGGTGVQYSQYNDGRSKRTILTACICLVFCCIPHRLYIAEVQREHVTLYHTRPVERITENGRFNRVPMLDVWKDHIPDVGELV